MTYYNRGRVSQSAALSCIRMRLWHIPSYQGVTCALKPICDDDDVTKIHYDGTMRAREITAVTWNFKGSFTLSAGSKDLWQRYTDQLVCVPEHMKTLETVSWNSTFIPPTTHTHRHLATWTWVKPGFHYPSWRPVNSASGNARPSTRPVLTGNGNRSPVNSGSGNRALVN